MQHELLVQKPFTSTRMQMQVMLSYFRHILYSSGNQHVVISAPSGELIQVSQDPSKWASNAVHGDLVLKHKNAQNENDRRKYLFFSRKHNICQIHRHCVPRCRHTHRHTCTHTGTSISDQQTPPVTQNAQDLAQKMYERNCLLRKTHAPYTYLHVTLALTKNLSVPATRMTMENRDRLATWPCYCCQETLSSDRYFGLAESSRPEVMPTCFSSRMHLLASRRK